MSDKNILATFHKHIGVINDEPKSMTKSQIHRFSENMKGVNEFIGALQSISINLNKIKNLAEKISSLEGEISAQDYKSTQQILSIEKQNYANDIEHIATNASFMGIELFDMELSCVVGGKVFELNIENPMNYIENNLFGYCIQKQDEITSLLGEISARLNAPSDTSEDINSYSSFDSAIFGKRF